MKYFLNFNLLLSNRNYGILFIGQFVSFLGTMVASVALPYQIYHQTHSTLMVGLLGFFQLIPLLFTALIGGVFADRYHRRMLLLISESILAVCTLILAWNASSMAPHIWLTFLVATLMSGVTGLHRPALESITQQIVKPSDFTTVGALMSFKFGFCMIVGLALGGLLIDQYGVVVTFIIDFFSFLFSLIAIYLVRNVPKPVANQVDESTFLSIKKGFKYAASRQELIGTYLVDFVAMIFGMPTALFPAIAATLGGAKTLGLLYAAPAVGELVVACLSGWTHKVKRHGAAVAISAALWGISIIFFGLADNIWVAFFFLALSGIFDGLSGIYRSTIWNQTIPTNLRGRMAGIEMVSYLSGPRLGDTEAGLIASVFGVTASVVSGGVLCVAGVLICCTCLPKFWNYVAKDTT